LILSLRAQRSSGSILALYNYIVVFSRRRESIKARWPIREATEGLSRGLSALHSLAKCAARGKARACTPAKQRGCRPRFHEGRVSCSAGLPNKPAVIPPSADSRTEIIGRRLLRMLKFDYIGLNVLELSRSTAAVIAALLIGAFSLCVPPPESSRDAHNMDVIGDSVCRGMILLPSKNHLLGDGFTLIAVTDRFLRAYRAIDQFSISWSSRLLVPKLSLIEWSALPPVFLSFWVIPILTLWSNALEKASSSFPSPARQRYNSISAMLNITPCSIFCFSITSTSRGETSPAIARLFSAALLRSRSLSHFSAIVLLPSLFYLYRRRYRMLIRCVGALIIVCV